MIYNEHGSEVVETVWNSDELLRYWYMGLRLCGGAEESQNRRNSANRPEKFNVYDHWGYELYYYIVFHIKDARVVVLCLVRIPSSLRM
jgi:hypothetical protein